VNFASDANNNSKDFAVFPPNPRNTSETALPITLNIFTANKIEKANRIHWQVNCLSTSVTFELERSSTLQNFTTIYTSTESKARCATPFDFNDNNPQNGTNYYRLKIIDIDANVSYSKIALSINSLREINRLKITPNIVSSVAELHYTSDKSEKIKLQVSDLQGRIIKKASIAAAAGDNKIIISTNEFSKGQYHATIFINGEKSAAAKFVKQ
ncbi:MAG: T9SS type A sorting domain-containing protein, partial [Ginsengibacter sp.]